MVKSLLCVIVLIFLGGCSAKQPSLSAESEKVQKLTQDLMALGKNVDKKEAALLAKEAITYPKVLAKEYDLVSPANYHNLLINLKKQKFKSFDLRWAVSHKGGPEEHNSVVAVAKGAAFETGILLDPWRNSGDLFWSRLTHDEEKFQWVEDKKRTTKLGTVNVLK